MRLIEDEGKAPAGRFLSRLARDKAAATIPMLAIALLPIAAFAGSAVDMTRLYVVRSRLQQACDAGALAGRRFMADDADHELDAPARGHAETFFNNNFKNGWLGTRNTIKSFDESGTQQVTGSAQTLVPMTIMGMFSSPNKTLKVSCAARLDIPDVDIMLVLDTTGSMACSPTESGSCAQATNAAFTQKYIRSDGSTGYKQQEKSSSRIVALRSAVINFWTVMNNAADTRTNIRYGIVPYTSTVNAGYQIPANFVLNTSHSYQSRIISADDDFQARYNETIDNKTSAECDALVDARVPGEALKFDTNGDAKRHIRKVSWASNKCVMETQRLRPKWRFGKFAADISRYAKGEKVQDPSKYQTTEAHQNRWKGCLEERGTAPGESFGLSSSSNGFDVDLTPNSDDTRWRPMWPEQMYLRFGTELGYPEYNDDQFPNTYPNSDYYWYWPNVGGDPNYAQPNNTACPKEVQRLRKTTLAEMTAFVNAPEFVPNGGTYHDVGMIWGLRFISPTGPFRNDTAAWPGRGEPNRHIIFMTDGDMQPRTQVASMYGLERYDNRMGAGGSDTEAIIRHNARFRAVCAAARASPRNITVWVIAFGQALNADLSACASSADHDFEVRDTKGLNDAFTEIARQIGALRIYNK